MKLEAVFFDFGNTLVYAPDNFAFLKQSGVEKIAKILTRNGYGVDVDKLTQVLIAHRDAAAKKAQETGYEITARSWFKTAFEASGIDHPSQSLLNQCVQSYYEPNLRYLRAVNHALETLENLSQMDYRLGVISNATESLSVRRVLANFGFLPWFQSVIISADVRFRKPRKEIFDLALAAMQVQEASQAVIIGDRRSTDVAGARCAGLRSIQLTIVKNHNDDGPAPDAIARSLQEVEEIIYSWS